MTSPNLNIWYFFHQDYHLFSRNKNPHKLAYGEFFIRTHSSQIYARRRGTPYGDRGEHHKVYKEAVNEGSQLPFPVRYSFPQKHLPHELLHSKGSLEFKFWTEILYLAVFFLDFFLFWLKVWVVSMPHQGHLGVIICMPMSNCPEILGCIFRCFPLFHSFMALEAVVPSINFITSAR